MSVTTSARIDQARFDELIGGRAAYTWNGGLFARAEPKTITGLTVTDQQIGPAVTAAADFLTGRETTQTAAVTALRQAYPTIRQWASDAAATNTNWPAMTAAQKDAATRETIRRLGVFLDRFGDLLQTLNADT